MANLKSSKKRAIQNVSKRKRNLSRKTGIKTSIKKVLVAVDDAADTATVKKLLRDASAKIARAGSKGVMHKRTAARKIGRLSKRVAKAERK